MLRNLRELYQYRTLLWALTQRELSARYRTSVFGFLWTFLNPLLNMLIYVLVFGVLLDSGVPNFPFFLFTALVPWLCFSTSITNGSNSINERRDLLTKVRLPPQVLPATTVATNLTNMLLTLPLLVGLGIVFHNPPTWHIIALPLVIVVQTLFTLAIAYLLSSLAVIFRDLVHIVANLTALWFFCTPVFWNLRSIRGITLGSTGVSLTADEIQRYVLYVNPVATFTESWRDIFYWHRLPNFEALAIMTVLSVLLFAFATHVFEQRRDDFAELI